MVFMPFWCWGWFSISVDSDIVMVVMVMAAVRLEGVISSYHFNCMFCGGIWGVDSGSGVNRGSGSSSIAHNCHH